MKTFLEKQLPVQAVFKRALRSPILKHVLFILKLAVTISLCTWLVVVVDWGQLWHGLRQSNYWLILLVLVLRMLDITISSYKWQLFLAVHELHYGMGQLQRWYLTSTFLSRFLPTSIGGDSYRIYKTLDNPKGGACAVLAILGERTSGLLALLLLGLVAAIITYIHNGDELSRILMMLGVVGVVLGFTSLWVLVRRRIAQKLAKKKFCPTPVASFIRSMGDIRRHPQQAALASAISFVFHANRILGYWLLIYALGTACDIAELTVAIALMTVIGLLPISLGGLGTTDISFIYLMNYYGLSFEICVLTMLISRFMMILFSLVGGYFYLFGSKDKPKNKLVPPVVKNA